MSCCAPLPRPLLQMAFQFQYPVFSPNGRWLAYSSDVSGSLEVYVQAYPELGERYQISVGGGVEPSWAHSGREIFYRQGDKMMVADIGTSPHFGAGKPRLLFSGPYGSDTPVRGYDVAPDDKRFLMFLPLAEKQQTPATQMTVVLNWTEELKRLVPTR